MRIIIVGKAACGKDYFRNWLNSTELLDVSFTTRPKREGEISGYTYNYISKADFEELDSKGFFLEKVVFNGWNYGTSIESWENNTVFIMTPSGISDIPKKDRKDCVIVYFDVDEKTRRKRIKLRSDADSVERRINADEIDFKNFTDFDIRVSRSDFSTQTLFTDILNFSKR